MAARDLRSDANAATPQGALPQAKAGWRWGPPQVLDLIVIKRGVYVADDKVMLVARRITGMFGLILRGGWFIGVMRTDEMDIREFALGEAGQNIGGEAS